MCVCLPVVCVVFRRGGLREVAFSSSTVMDKFRRMMAEGRKPLIRAPIPGQFSPPSTADQRVAEARVWQTRQSSSARSLVLRAFWWSH